MVAFAAGDGNRKAIVYISAGYDLDAFPALSDRVTAFARRAREDGVTIFAIDVRSLEGRRSLIQEWIRRHGVVTSPPRGAVCR